MLIGHWIVLKYISHFEGRESEESEKAFSFVQDDAKQEEVDVSSSYDQWYNVIN